MYLHANQRQLVTDQNNDDFLDLPLAKQVNLLSRWQYTDAEKGWVSFASVRFWTTKNKRDPSVLIQLRIAEFLALGE